MQPPGLGGDEEWVGVLRVLLKGIQLRLNNWDTSAPTSSRRVRYRRGSVLRLRCRPISQRPLRFAGFGVGIHELRSVKSCRCICQEQIKTRFSHLDSKIMARCVGCDNILEIRWKVDFAPSRYRIASAGLVLIHLAGGIFNLHCGVKRPACSGHS